MSLNNHGKFTPKNRHARIPGGISPALLLATTLTGLLLAGLSGFTGG